MSIDSNKFSSIEAAKIQKYLKFEDDAFIDFAQGNAPNLIRKVTLDLSTARTSGNPYKAGFSFKSLFVYQATDSSVEVNFQPFTDNSNDTFPLLKNGVLNFDFPVKNAFLTWDAQSGKEMTLIFLLDGSYKAGSTLVEVSSSVDGNAISVPSQVTLNGTVGALVAQDLNRKVLNIYASGAWLIGPSSTGNFYPMPAGYSKISNTAAMYAKTTGATVTVDLLQED